MKNYTVNLQKNKNFVLLVLFSILVSYYFLSLTFRTNSCTGLGARYSSFSYNSNVWDCALPINNLGYSQWPSLRYLKQFERYITLGTYFSSDFSFKGPGLFPIYPSSRYETFSYAFADFELRKGKVIVEVGTSRSFQHGGGPGCNKDEPHFWHPDNPADWDWTAGHFTALACNGLGHLLRRPGGKMFTVDLAHSHIQRSKHMTKECSDILNYKVASSLDFFQEYDVSKFGQIDLLYLDTGDMTPVEVTATLHLEEARLVVERQLVSPNGIILIDDVRNLTPKKYGEPHGDTYGKAKYSIDFFLEHGFSMVKSEYQVILRNSQDQLVATFHSREKKLTTPIKILHVSYHQGCIEEIKYIVGRVGGVQLESLFWEGFSGEGNEKFNINRQRSTLYWQALKSRALAADMVITSDTVALSRIFIQNKYPGKLVIWVCNRFDYFHSSKLSLPSQKEIDLYAGDHPAIFPDREFYNMIRSAALHPRTAIVSYTPFEAFYAKKYKNTDLGNEVLRPTGRTYKIGNESLSSSLIPNDIIKSKTLFIPPYQNDVRLVAKCKELKILCHRGRYAGSADLAGFKAVLHLPYAWSNFALFEIASEGLIYIIPSLDFLKKIMTESNYWFQDMYAIDHIELSEWYDPQNKDIFIYYNSWADLPVVLRNTNFHEKTISLKKFMVNRDNEIIEQWKATFFKI